MEINNNNEIQIMKLKKRKQYKDKFTMDEMKRNGIDSNIKLTQKNDINNNNNLTNQPQNNERNKKRKKSTKKNKYKTDSIDPIDSIKDSLANISEMIIKQEADILEAVTGCQEPNNYYVYGRLPNGEKIYIFKCREFSSCGMRYFCPVNCREFSMRIKIAIDEDENDEDEEFESRIVDINKDCKCPFLCFIRPDMKVILAQKNQKLGTIEQSFSFCDPVFYIYDKDDKELFYIEADCCQCGFACRNNFMGKTDEAQFFIYHIGDRSNPVGDICKKAAKSMFSIADNYSVILPKNATIEEKILLTVAGIMIDYQYFEKNTNSK